MTTGHDRRPVRHLGGPEGTLHDSQVVSFISDGMAGMDLDGRSLCIVIPDSTRHCPLPLLLGAIEGAVSHRVSSCTAVVALGTHAPMTTENMRAMVGGTHIDVVNHEWWDDDMFLHLGTLQPDRISDLSGGFVHEAVDVRVNRLVVESDVTLIVGPVLPHEVVGFSGGNKYLFPGLSGPELIDVTHWLGALITSREIIGTRGFTPVRAIIEEAAGMVTSERHALCVVVEQGTDALHSISLGDPVKAWDSAAAVAATTHVQYLDHPVGRVVSLVAERYDDLWTGAKGFYKVEPVLADGGEVIIHAPHIAEISSTHPALSELGYHCRDFFIDNWERYRGYPHGELAHSTHLYGAGTYDPTTGVETQRVKVTLSTGIPRHVVETVNLSYADPADLDLDALAADPDTLMVHDAGEVLYRLRDEGGSSVRGASVSA